MRSFAFILVLLIAGCSQSRLSDVDRAAIHALVGKEGEGKVEEIRREQSGMLRVSTTGTGLHGGKLYGIRKTQTGWVIVERGAWME